MFHKKSLYIQPKKSRHLTKECLAFFALHSGNAKRFTTLTAVFIHVALLRSYFTSFRFDHLAALAASGCRIFSATNLSSNFCASGRVNFILSTIMELLTSGCLNKCCKNNMPLVASRFPSVCGLTHIAANESLTVKFLFF